MSNVVNLKLVACGCVASVCLLSSGCAGVDEKFCQQRVWAWEICDGNGTDKPLFSKCDYFSLFAGRLLDPDQRLRQAAASDVITGTMLAGRRWDWILDAYIAARRVGELRANLSKAWQQAEHGSEERFTMGQALADLRMREYLWQHPRLAAEAGLAGGAWRRWDGFRGPRQRAFFANRLLAEGDEDFKRVWDDEQEHLKLLKEDKLKPMERLD